MRKHDPCEGDDCFEGCNCHICNDVYEDICLEKTCYCCTKPKVTRRSHLETKVDILRTISELGEAKFSHILYKANLASKRLTEYLRLLEDKGYIKIDRERFSTNRYYITKQGENWLAAYDLVLEAI